MGLDIKEFKDKSIVKGENAYIGNPEAIKASEIKRGRDGKIVDQVIELEINRLQTENEASKKRQEYNQLGNLIRAKKKQDQNDSCKTELEKKSNLEQEIKLLEEKEQQALQQRDKKLNQVGNIIHESVAIGDKEESNKIEKQWGTEFQKQITPNNLPGNLHHDQILQMIDGFDPIRGHKVAGNRGYFLKGYGFLLNQALIQYGIKFLMTKGYTSIQPPYFMNAEMMGATCQLGDFDEQLYNVTTKHSKSQQTEEQEKEDQEDEVKNSYYLIATSEQPISAMHQKETIVFKKGESIKYAGFSTNFRKEAGSAGKETWGIYRVHQFEKIEQFILCKPEDSWKIHEEMTKTAEEFLETLELPYQRVNIASGALNDAAAKKYDIEAWFPGYGEFKELMSVSNCTDYQSRALQIRCGNKQKNEKIAKYVHMLNGTLCATERTLTCILENYQEADGVRVPKVLQPYVGTDFIKFCKPLEKRKQ